MWCLPSFFVWLRNLENPYCLILQLCFQTLEERVLYTVLDEAKETSLSLLCLWKDVNPCLQGLEYTCNPPILLSFSVRSLRIVLSCIWKFILRDVMMLRCSNGTPETEASNLSLRACQSSQSLPDVVRMDVHVILAIKFDCYRWLCWIQLWFYHIQIPLPSFIVQRNPRNSNTFASLYASSQSHCLPFLN